MLFNIILSCRSTLLPAFTFTSETKTWMFPNSVSVWHHLVQIEIDKHPQEDISHQSKPSKRSVDKFHMHDREIGVILIKMRRELPDEARSRTQRC
jgi:hypothetical protein